MKCDKETVLLYAVTDRAWVGRLTLYEQVEAALENGVTCVQLREKKLDRASFLKEAMELAKLCRRYHVPFIVNDDVDLAIESGADGVHVGQEDMAAAVARRRIGDRMILGVSAHTVAEAQEAVRNGADYLGVGAVFTTSTKTDVRAMPIETLQAIRAAVGVPIAAIGGISKENILRLSGSGVDGVAVVSAIFGAEDPGKAAAELLELSRKMVYGHG